MSISNLAMSNSIPLSPQKQEKLELLDLLIEKERRLALDPLKYAKQHEKQVEASKSQEAIRALFWGNRVGKTEWGAQEVAKYSLGKHEYKDIVPPVEIWCTCPSYDQQKETTQKKLTFYLPKNDIKDITYVKKNTWGELVLFNGTRINFKSYEQGREKFQGVGKRLIWFDEEPPRDIWEECFVRSEAGIPLDIILTMTPVKGMTWVYDEIYLDTANPDLFISEAGWDDNPWLTEDQKRQMARGLTPEAIKVRREGKFVKRVGLVCSWWDREEHIKHYDRLDTSWSWYEVLDGGYSDPAAWLLIGVDNDNSIHVVKGFREKGLTSKAIKERRDGMIGGVTITSGWIDSDDPRLAKELTELGMPLQQVEKIPGESKSWDESLANRLAEYGQIQPGTGKPRLYISDSLVRFDEDKGVEVNWMVQEIENLVWLEKQSKEGGEIQPKWDAHRRFGHHFDGLYALAYFAVSYMGGVSEEMPRDQQRFDDWSWNAPKNRNFRIGA